MQIKSILARLSGPAHFGHQKEAAEAIARKVSQTAGHPATPPALPSARLREILAKYDVTNISPRAFSELLQKLRQAGFLPDQDFQELSLIRQDLERDGIGSGERVDLVTIYAKKLQALQQDANELEEKLGAAGVRALETSIRRRLDWLEKLAAIHSSPDAATINALA